MTTYQIEMWDTETRKYRVMWSGSEDRAEVQFRKPYYGRTKRLVKLTRQVIHTVKTRKG